MSEADLIIRGARVVNSIGVTLADVAIAGGKIAAVGPNLAWSAPEAIDASGLHVFPGGIDSHVHLNEPGRTDWETIATGSTALAAGGYTTFVDMPLNSSPVTVDGAAFDAKLGAATASSLVDFALWGGLVPGNLDRLDDMVARGAAGFKAFMCPSGIDEFPACDEEVLREGMRRIARLDSILLVHAEDPRVLEAQRARSTEKTASDFILSRPPEAELGAISAAITLAAETGCRLHVVHVSTAKGFDLILEAQARGVDVSGETCPHYLLYTKEDLERLGGLGKCAPPFRTSGDRFGLWQKLTGGQLPMVVSDHSPSTLELKQGADFSMLWGGISGCQSTRHLLLARSLGIPTVAAVTATNIARRFGLKNKGEVAVGFDADLWLVDLDRIDVVRREDLLYLNRFSAHEGQRIRGQTVRTLVRGETVFAAGRPASKPVGQFIRPGGDSQRRSPD
jgi:allantoinase